ncbi:AAA family ATPase [Patescibacteria group bacterium]|nr:AAA family ATPase [Patescibacteria group bacterium]
MILTIVGGASGVGKTSLLKQTNSKAKQVNTGTLFKKHMTLEKRDDVRKNDWSVYEKDVINDLSNFVLKSFRHDENIIIDTHFAAKIYGRNYRIGLKEKLLFDFGTLVFKEIKTNILIQVALITVDPHALLARRRLDESRDRELIPLDCYNDLRSNDVYSTRYSGEISRAFQKSGHIGENIVKYYRIENNDFKATLTNLKNILGG